MKAPLKKRLWQAVVQRKIENQAAALAALGCIGAPTLHEMSRRVRSGDPGNVEARAARFHWSRLWREFVREDCGDRRNKLVNYGRGRPRRHRPGARRLRPVAGFSARCMPA